MENQYENIAEVVVSEEPDGKRHRPYPSLDYTITDPQERNKIVH